MKKCNEEYHKSLEDKKYCKYCDKVKDKSEFNLHKKSPDGYQYRCKDCKVKYYIDNKTRLNNIQKIANKNRYENRKNGLYKVYHLPNVTEQSPLGYVGSTLQGVRFRMYTHTAVKRDITNYRVLAEFKTHEEALHYESEMHLQGYAGGLNEKERIKLNKYLQCQNTQTNKNKES